MPSNSFFKRITSVLSKSWNNLTGKELCESQCDREQLNNVLDKLANELEVYLMYARIDDCPLSEDQRREIMNHAVTYDENLKNENNEFGQIINKNLNSNVYDKYGIIYCEEKIKITYKALEHIALIVHGMHSTITQEFLFGNRRSELPRDFEKLKRVMEEKTALLFSYQSHGQNCSLLSDAQRSVILNHIKVYNAHIKIVSDEFLRFSDKFGVGILNHTDTHKCTIPQAFAFNKIILITQIALDNIKPIVDGINVLSVQQATVQQNNAV